MSSRFVSVKQVVFKEKNMLRLQWPRRKKKGRDADGRKPLLDNVTKPHTETTDGEQILKCIESTDQSGVYFHLIAPEAEVNGEQVLSILRQILHGQSTPQEFDAAAAMVKSWGKLNGITTGKKEGRYAQGWLCEYLQEIDQFVEQHFPTLPTEGPKGSHTQLEDYLKLVGRDMCNEVLRLTSVLNDAGLLGHLINSYSHHLFTKLDLLLNRDLSVNETFHLLRWGKWVFFSPDLADVFRVHDPLLLSGWFERAKEKLLQVFQKEISNTLQNILCYEEQYRPNGDSMDEEDFIRVHLDVIQCLNAVILNAKEFSLTLTHEVQKICCEELHGFVQMFVHTEKKHLEKLQPLKTENAVYLFWLINTCRQLRFFAAEINSLEINNGDDLVDMVFVLQKMEDDVVSIVQKMMKHMAQDNLRSYFKQGNEHIHKLTEAILNLCASLPQTDVGKEIQMIIVNLAYDCVSRVYLDCLMKIKFKQLKKRWGNVEERIKEDVLYFHETFTEWNGSDDPQNQLLKRMSEVLLHCDAEAMKLTCASLFKDFQEDSKQYLPGLLRWKGVLSEQKVREVLDASRQGCPNPGRVNRHLLMDLCCCLCYE